MDYKEKYEMALEGIQEILSSGEDSIKMSRLQLRLQGIFPELKNESEDERIRKKLIALIEWSKSYAASGITTDEAKEMTDWVEKQGNNMGISEATKKKLEDNLNKALEKETPESWNKFLDEQGEHQKFVDSIQIGDKVTRNEDGVLVNLSQLKRIAKPVEEYNITGIGSKNAQGKLGEMIKNLKPINEILEQKSTWSEEDEKRLTKVLVTLNDAYASKELLNWVESLKDRVLPQPKQEWSKENETGLTNTIIMLKEGASLHFNKKDITKAVNWLKSLKERYAWKPSDEQMKALESIFAKHGAYNDDLLSLISDLKKLKE